MPRRANSLRGGAQARTGTLRLLPDLQCRVYARKRPVKRKIHRTAPAGAAAAVSDLGASCATRIFCDHDGWTGSLGVFVVMDDVSRM